MYDLYKCITLFFILFYFFNIILVLTEPARRSTRCSSSFLEHRINLYLFISICHVFLYFLYGPVASVIKCDWLIIPDECIELITATTSYAALPILRLLSFYYSRYMVMHTYIMSVNCTIHLLWLLWVYIPEIYGVIDTQECWCARLRLSKQAPIASVTPVTALGLPACNFMAQKYTMSHSVNIHSWWSLAHLPPVSSPQYPRSFFAIVMLAYATF